MRVREYNQHRRLRGRGFNKISWRAIAANACPVWAIAMIHRSATRAGPFIRCGRRRVWRLINTSLDNRVTNGSKDSGINSGGRAVGGRPYRRPAVEAAAWPRMSNVSVSITTPAIPAKFGMGGLGKRRGHHRPIPRGGRIGIRPKWVKMNRGGDSSRQFCRAGAEAGRAFGRRRGSRPEQTVRDAQAAALCRFPRMRLSRAT